MNSTNQKKNKVYECVCVLIVDVIQILDVTQKFYKQRDIRGRQLMEPKVNR